MRPMGLLPFTWWQAVETQTSKRSLASFSLPLHHSSSNFSICSSVQGKVQQVFFNFRGFLCRLSKKVKEKIVCLEIFMLYFLSGSGTSLTPFVQLCASECLQFPVSKFPNAVGQQIIVHHRGTPCCSLPPVCSCISFLSFSSCLSSHLLM